MTPEAVQGWLYACIEAWRSYDAGAIADRFTEGATYRYNPWAEPIQGREAIVAEWQDFRDEFESCDAEYRPFVVAGNRAVGVGETRYAGGKTFFNSWQLTFGRDARCSAFVEWHMTPPDDQQ